MPVRIEVPLPLPLRTANAWLFPARQGPSALVDCGIGTPDGYRVLREGLWDSGIDANGLRLFVTHGHIDHAGNAARLRREFGALLHAAPAEAPFVERFRSASARRYEAYGEALRAHGVPEEELARMRARGEALDPLTEDVPIASPLADGQRVRLGDTDATVHLAPGHTPGSVLYATAENDLLTGDTLLQHITSNAIELVDRDRGRYAQYLRTLDGLRRFAGMRALPGHHEPFQLTEALLDDHLEKHRRRSARIRDRLDRPHTAWELLPHVFPHLAADQSFLGMCEVVGHLVALEEQGDATCATGPDGVRRYVRA